MRAVRLLAAAVSDELRRRLGLAPLYIKLVGNRDELCLLELEESELSKKNHKPPPRQASKFLVIVQVLLSASLLCAEARANLFLPAYRHSATLLCRKIYSCAHQCYTMLYLLQSQYGMVYTVC